MNATEELFDRFVTAVGGEKITPTTTNPSVENADYYFPDNGAIIELKSIESKEFRLTPQVAEVWDKIMENMNDTEESFYHYYEGQPQQRIANLHRDFFSPLFTKANRQLRSTKKLLNTNNNLGILVVINNQYTLLTIPGICYLIDNFLRNSFRSIDAVVYASYSHGFNPLTGLPRRLWLPRYRPTEAPTLISFVDWLGGEWIKFLDEEHGPLPTRIYDSYTELNKELPRMPYGEYMWGLAIVLRHPTSGITAT